MGRQWFWDDDFDTPLDPGVAEECRRVYGPEHGRTFAQSLAAFLDIAQARSALVDAVVDAAAVARAWRNIAPPAAWRGRLTGLHALDLLALGEVVHESPPAVVVMAGRLGLGGLPLFVADCLDDNHHGKVVAGESMSRERQRTMPKHRRIQWVSSDLLVEDFRTASRLSTQGNPVLVVASPTEKVPTVLDLAASLVTPGSYLVVHGPAAVEARHFPPRHFLADPGRDPAGLSACAWLLRVPA